MNATARKPSMRVQDMTVGSPLKLILTFAIPIFIGNIFQQIYSIIDTMVVGYTLGDAAISAIGASASLYSLLINVAIGMNSGFSIITTQSFGAHDEKRLRHSIAGTVLLNVVITSIVMVLSLTFLRPLMVFMNTPASIFNDAYRYIFIICAGMFSTVTYNMCAGILQALGNSRTPLFFLMISCIINIILDILLVAVFPLGVAGASLATIIAQTISALLCGAYLLRNYRAILPRREDFHVTKSVLTALFSSGLAMALMYCVVDLGSVIFQRANNALGELYITSYTASRRLIIIASQPGGTISTSTATFIGQNWGAGKKQRIQDTIKQIITVEILWGFFICAVIYLIGEFLVKFTTGTSDPVIIQNAVLSLRIHLPFFPALGSLVCLRSGMQAMGYKTAPVISSCMELAMKILSAAFLIPTFGFVGTCVTEPVTWFIMMIYLGISYLSLKKKILGTGRNSDLA